MINKLSIRNYKTINKLELELGRVTVLIGENGAGKSNILEAISLAGAASSNKLDNEYLRLRGIRTSEPDLMRSAFSQKNETEDCSIYINVESDKDGKADFKLTNDNKPFSSWECEIEIQNSEGSTPGLIDILNNVYFSNSVSEKEKKESISQLKELFSKLADFKNQDKTKDEWEKYLKDNLLHSLSKNEVLTKYYINNKIQLNDVTSALSKFIIYSPENSHLRSTEKSSSSIEPLGIKGEGLLKLVYILSNIENKKIIATVKRKKENEG